MATLCRSICIGRKACQAERLAGELGGELGGSSAASSFEWGH